tara:strand:+ start:191 stop:514 length:324 start_codon:yes stop_codon:yes gene_type:complete
MGGVLPKKKAPPPAAAPAAAPVAPQPVVPPPPKFDPNPVVSAPGGPMQASMQGVPMQSGMGGSQQADPGQYATGTFKPKRKNKLLNRPSVGLTGESLTGQRKTMLGS